MSQDTMKLLRRLRPTDAGATRELFGDAQRAALRATILAVPAPARPGARVRAPRRRPRLVPALGAAGIAGLAAVVLVVALGRSAASPPVARAVVAFHAGAGGDIVATVVNPFAAQAQLDQAFQQHGFDITVTLMPVSPSLVGTVIYMSGGGITPLQSGACITGGGGCSIGVRIAANFSGQGAIALGRPAQSGETYSSSASAFAAGEPLHCSGLLGAQVGVAQPQLAAGGYAVQWRETVGDRSQVDATPPPDNYIWDAMSSSAGNLIVSTAPQPWPADSTHGAVFNSGCPASQR